MWKNNDWAIDHTHRLIFMTHTFFHAGKGSTTQYHVLEKPKAVGQASLDWNTHSSPCSLNNLKQVARHIWVSRKISYCQVRHRLQLGQNFFFFYNQGIFWTRSSLILLYELCAFSVFGSLCLFSTYDSSASHFLPIQGLSILTSSVFILFFLGSNLPCNFSDCCSLS